MFVCNMTVIINDLRRKRFETLSFYACFNVNCWLLYWYIKYMGIQIYSILYWSKRNTFQAAQLVSTLGINTVCHRCYSLVVSMLVTQCVGPGFFHIQIEIDSSKNHFMLIHMPK